MMSNSRLFLALGIGVALLSFLGKSRKENRLQEKQQKKKEITTWEGEGGNLPPSIPAPPSATAH